MRIRNSRGQLHGDTIAVDAVAVHVHLEIGSSRNKRMPESELSDARKVVMMASGVAHAEGFGTSHVYPEALEFPPNADGPLEAERRRARRRSDRIMRGEGGCGRRRPCSPDDPEP